MSAEHGSGFVCVGCHSNACSESDGIVKATFEKTQHLSISTTQIDDYETALEFIVLLLKGEYLDRYGDVIGVLAGTRLNATLLPSENFVLFFL